jgi:fatty acid desaturase
MPGRPAPDNQNPYQALFQELRRDVERRGLLARRHGWYIARSGVLLLLLAAATAICLRLGNTWWQVLVATLYGGIFTQFAFLGHDVAHRQAVGSRRVSSVLGYLVINGLVGASYGWWMDRHSRHHGQPNRVNADPDIGNGLIVNTVPAVDYRRTALGRVLARKQSVLFFAALLIAMGNLRLVGILGGVRNWKDRRRVVESLIIVARLGAFTGFTYYVLPPGKATVFLAAEAMCSGVYLGACFAPNHIGMPIVPAGMPIDFLRRQVMASRNIKGGRLMDLAMGGLNLQIEHHLFPSMPAPSLRLAVPVVRDFCAAHGIPYHEQGLLRAYRDLAACLDEVGISGPRLMSPLSSDLRAA